MSITELNYLNSHKIKVKCLQLRTVLTFVLDNL